MVMLEEINEAAITYFKKWEDLVAQRQNQDFFRGLKSTSVGWKTLDLADFNHKLLELMADCDQVHLGWVNERWLASLHLKDSELPGGIKIIKLMQRRPGSIDPVGLDHLDFYAESEAEIIRVLAEEKNLVAAEESNNPLCHWHSIQFDDTEAKLRADTVLDVCIAELKEINESQ